MKKNEIRIYIALAMIFAVFTMISFAVPFDRNGIFWLGYIFGVIAIVFQVYFLKISFFREGDAKSKFYGFPIARVGLIYLTVQMITSLIEMAIGKYIPFWIVLIINVLIIAKTLSAARSFRRELNLLRLC